MVFGFPTLLLRLCIAIKMGELWKKNHIKKKLIKH